MATTRIVGTIAATDTGKLLQAYCVRKRICKAALSRVIGRNISSLVKILKNDTIQTEILWDICFALQHNFFSDIADQLPKEFGSDVVIDDTAERRIEELEKEVEILKGKLEVLEGVLRGK